MALRAFRIPRAPSVVCNAKPLRLSGRTTTYTTSKFIGTNKPFLVFQTPMLQTNSLRFYATKATTDAAAKSQAPQEGTPEKPKISKSGKCTVERWSCYRFLKLTVLS